MNLLPLRQFSQIMRNSRNVVLLPMLLLLLNINSAFSQITINEFDATGVVEITNSGTQSVDISGYWLCNFPAYTQLSNLTLDCGSLDLAPGDYVAVSGFDLNANDAELGLYTSSGFGNPNNIIDYVEWGFAGHTRASVAITAGIWSTDDFLPSIPSGQSYSFDGDGDASTDFFAGANTFCEENISIAVVNGGALTGGPFVFCVDGATDNVAGIELNGNSGMNSAWIVTDDQGNILGLPPMPSAVDFDAAGEGVCLIYHISYEDGLTGLAGGNNLTDLTGDFDLSNSITVYRESPDGGTVQLVGGGTEYTGTAGNIVLDVEHTTNANFLSYWYIITDADNNDNVLGFANSANTNTLDLSGAPTGTCRIWGWSYRGLEDPIIGEPISQLTDDACEAISDNFITVNRQEATTVDGGTLTGGPFVFCVDGATDNVAGIELNGNSGMNSAWIVTDDQGNILGLPPMPSAVDFDAAGEGVCLIYHISYEDGLTGLAGGNNLTDLTGDFDLSNSITVYRESPDGGTVQLVGGGTEYTGTAGNIVLDVEHTTTANFLSYWYIITDADNNDNVLGFANSANTNTLDLSGAPAGTCRIWGWSYRGLEDPIIGEPISQLTDDACEAISDNFITVTRLPAVVEIETFTAELTGSQEVPCPVVTPAYGSLNFDLEDNTLTLTGSFGNLAGDFDATINGGSHIHFAQAGSNGGIEVIIVPTLSEDLRSGTFEAANNTFELTDAQVTYLRNREMYVNIHTTFSAPGELRGQIIPTADHNLQANLSGLNEVPAINSEAYGNILLEVRGNELIAHGSFQNVNSGVNTALAGGAHIHLGNPGINGPVAFILDLELSADSTSAAIYPGRNTFILTDDELDSLQSGGYYINVHSLENAPGELRGQITPTANISFIADLSGANEVPANDATSTGRVQVDFNAATQQITINGSFSDFGSALNVDLAGGAHIHLGAANENGPVAFPFVAVTTNSEMTNGLFLPSQNTFDVTNENIEALFNEGFYVNVHSLDNAPGEVRGQLLPLTCRSLNDTCDANGGTLEGGPFIFCVDGDSDNISEGAITLSGNSGTNNQVVVTDEAGIILGLPPVFAGPDFDAAGVGTCFVYNLAFEDGIEGLEAGLNIANLEGCFSFSNSITVYRESPDGGTVQLVGGGTEYTGTAGNIVVEVEHTTSANFLSYWYIITDADNNDNVLGFANSANTNTLDLSGAPAGTCRIWGWSYRGLEDPIIGEPISQLTDDACEAISSNFITVNRAPAGNDQADLSLDIYANSNIYTQFENTDFTISVTNEGTQNATNVDIDVTFPDGLVYVSHATSNGILNLGTQGWEIADLAPGATATLNLTLFATAENTDLNYFVQVISLDQIDADSTPDSSDGDVTEDDEALVTLTPSTNGGFATNNGNLDLELSITTENTTYDIFEVVRYRIEVKNNGNETATGVVVSAGLPEGMVFTNATVNNGEYNLFFEEWTIDFVGAGTTATLDLDLFTLVQDVDITNFVQIFITNERDPDSTPGNSNGIVSEDDEASVTLTYANAIDQNQLIQSRTAATELMNIEQIYPNPATDFIMLPINSEIDLQTAVNVLDVNGRLVATQTMKIFEGYNRLNVNINELSEGVYFLSLEGLDIKNSNRRFVKIAN